MPPADIKRGALSLYLLLLLFLLLLWMLLPRLADTWAAGQCVRSQETEIIVGRTHVSMPSGPRGNTKQEQDGTGRQAGDTPHYPGRVRSQQQETGRGDAASQFLMLMNWNLLSCGAVDAAYAQFNCCEICRMSMSSAIVVATAAAPQRQRCFPLVAVPAWKITHKMSHETFLPMHFCRLKFKLETEKRNPNWNLNWNWNCVFVPRPCNSFGVSLHSPWLWHEREKLWNRKGGKGGGDRGGSHCRRRD